ncbi:TPA: hypothetical protein ACU8BF_001802 [Neisseria subflava]|nr:hypothetical protein [Neisseria lactamica]
MLAALPLLFTTYSNAATPKAEASKPASAHKQTKQRFSGKITGYQTAEHLFSVRKGDRLRISKTGSPNAYFNVWAPKDDEAVFNGSAQGDKFDGIATQSGKYKVQVYMMPFAFQNQPTIQSGKYKVQVYMMRAQARRNTTAHYAVNVIKN